MMCVFPESSCAAVCSGVALLVGWVGLIDGDCVWDPWVITQYQ